MIISLLIDLAAAGFPIISAWLDRRKAAVVQLAGEVEPTDGPTHNLVGAAPAEVKTLVLAFLEKLRAKATSSGVQFAVTLLINFAPLLADQAWDAVAALLNGQQPAPAPVTAAAGDPAPSQAFAACCDQCFAD